MINTLKLAVKFLHREFAQGELRLLIISLIIATASLSSIGFLIHKINDAMTDHASQLNGAQLILKTPHAIKTSWLKKAAELHLQQAEMRVFPSMLVVNERFKLAQVKAVSDNFPLQGELLIKPLTGTAVKSVKAPPAGTIWLDQRLLDFFQLNTAQREKGGDGAEPFRVELGEAMFQPAAQVIRVPGQSSSLLRIAPTALINLRDLQKTATVQAGSRIDYIYFFSGDKPALATWKQWLKPRLQGSQTLIAGVEDVRAVNASLQKAGDYLSLAAILTVFLSAIAIAINTVRYGRSHYKNQAVMLCLGCRENQLLGIEMYKLLLTGLFSTLSGVIIGYLVYSGILLLVKDLISQPGADFYMEPALLAVVSGLLLLFSISLANLVQIKKISPMSLIRNNELAGIMTGKLFYVLGLAGLVLISWLYTDNLELTLIFYVSLLSGALSLYFIASVLLNQVIMQSEKHHWINRLTLLNLKRHRPGALLQITSFSLIFALVIIIVLLRTELLDKWRQQFPEQTPNHFVINIQSYETKDFEQFIQQHHIYTNGLYPMVRGRLVSLNHQPVKTVVPEASRNHNALNRELNLSVSQKGSYATPALQSNSAEPKISIEQSLAKALAIKKGDRLGFQIGDQKVQGVVTAFRKVKWDSFEPNFYIIFSPGVLEQYPMSWMGSFYLAAENKPVLNDMLTQFPGVTIIEVDEVLKEVQFIIDKISQAIEVIFLFIVVAGVLILASSLSATLESRLYENAVIRTLGASARQLRKCLWTEFTVIALLSAVIAIVLSEAASYILYQQIFNMSWAPHPWLWLIISLVSVILISSLGLLITNKIYTRTSRHSLMTLG